MADSDFQSKIFIVTGGAAGMGLATTKQLVKAGGIVHVGDIHPQKSDELAQLNAKQVFYSKCDVGKPDQCHAFVDKVIETHGRIDGVVACAGIAPLEDEITADDIFEKILDVNVRGVWYICTRALPHMKAQKSGNIVVFGSGASYRGIPKLSAYVASKHAVAGFTRCWAKDFAKYGIRVNAVAPGVVDTALVSNLKDGGPINTLLGLIPQGRMGQPNEIADSVMFLLSSKASYINGQLLPINGGAS